MSKRETGIGAGTRTSNGTETDTDIWERSTEDIFEWWCGAVIVVQVATLTFCVLYYEKCMTNGPKHAWPKK